MRHHAVYACSACLVALGCGSSFKAVDATGQLGSKIADHTAAIDTWANTCTELHDLTPGIDSLTSTLKGRTDLDAGLLSPAGDCTTALLPDASTANWRDASARIKQIALALAAYSAKLSAVANGKDLSFGKPAAAAIASIGVSGWTKDSTQTKIVDSVVRLFSEAYRHKALTDIIVETGPHITDAVVELDLAVEIVEENIRGLRDRLQAIDKSVANDALRASLNDAGVPVPQNIPLASGTLIATVRRLYDEQSDQMSAVESLHVAVDAFGKANAELVRHSHDLDTKDTLDAVLSAFDEMFLDGGAKDGASKD